jgi:hypothetical protein
MGVWFAAPGDQEELLARERGLTHVSVLAGGQNYGIFLSRGLLQRGLRRALENLPSKRLDTAGNFDPGGPIHVTDVSLELLPPDKIRTMIHGFDDRPVPDVDFRIIVTDTLSVENNRVVCADTRRHFDADGGLLAVLSALSAPTALMWFFLAERVAVEILGAAPAATPVDCWVQALVPISIPISGGRKFTLFWRTARVTHAGLEVASAGVAFEFGPRSPALDVLGPRIVVDRRGLGVVRSTYRTRMVDMRGPVRVEWFLDGHLLPGDDDLLARTINFRTTPGRTEVIELRVRVVDADGLAAGDRLAVTVQGLRPQGPLP